MARSHAFGIFVAAVALVASTPAHLHGASSKMQWLPAILQQTPGPIATDADAVVLLDYAYTSVAKDGQFTTEYRKVVQILTANGADAATVSINTNKKDKLKNLQARLILPGGKVRDYHEKNFVRAETHDASTVYTENWALQLDLSPSATPGSIVAYSYTLSYRSPVPQLPWNLSGKYPISRSVFHLQIPPGWDVQAVPVNRADYRETANGSTHTWEATNVPPVVLEDDSAVQNVYLGITIRPALSDLANCKMTPIDDWHSVASFATAMADPAAVPDAAIRAKAAELTQNCATQWERIKALCRYAQGVNYISVAMNLEAGGGFCPDPASAVFARNNGDCKAKTALLRAMLSCIDVRSYSVICYTGADAVAPAWPSPCQFNHCIVAFVAPEGLATAANIDDPELGRLILFDPTNENTPPGFLSGGIQNTHVLVSSDKSKALVVAPNGINSVRMNEELSMDASGKLSGVLECISSGNAANTIRGIRKHSADTDFRKTINRGLSRHTPDATIIELSTSDDPSANEVKTEIRFDAPDFARRIGKDRLLFRAFVDQSFFAPVPNCSSKERQTLFVLVGCDLLRDIVIHPPEGYVVEELPAELTLKESFGSICLLASEENGAIRLHLQCKMEDLILPPDSYGKVRSFFATLNKALQSTIVLRRK